MHIVYPIIITISFEKKSAIFFENRNFGVQTTIRWKMLDVAKVEKRHLNTLFQTIPMKIELFIKVEIHLEISDLILTEKLFIHSFERIYAYVLGYKASRMNS